MLKHKLYICKYFPILADNRYHLTSIRFMVLFHDFPEAAPIRPYTTEVLISHYLNIVTDSRNTNTDSFCQF